MKSVPSAATPITGPNTALYHSSTPRAPPRQGDTPVDRKEPHRERDVKVLELPRKREPDDREGEDQEREHRVEELDHARRLREQGGRCRPHGKPQHRGVSRRLLREAELEALRDLVLQVLLHVPERLL